MLALLKLVPLKDWSYLGVILGLLIAFGIWSSHERHVQAAKDATRDAALAAAQIARNEKVESHADQQITAAVDAFNKTEATPVPLVDIPRIVCSAAVAPDTVPGHGSSPSSSNGGAAVPEEGTVTHDPAFNPAPAVAQDGRDADAQIKLLQDYIHACMDAGICKAN